MTKIIYEYIKMQVLYNCSVGYAIIYILLELYS